MHHAPTPPTAARRLAHLVLAMPLALAAMVPFAPVPGAGAQDTPLVIAARTNAAIINPGLGTMTIVEVQDNSTIRKGFGNWGFDVEQLERMIIGTVNGETFSALRTGSPTCTPTAEDVIKLFSDKPTKKQTEAGQKDLRAQVREAEKAFWEKEHKFDGVVRGAFDGQYLMLVLPAKRAVLFYQDNGRDSLDLFSFHNFSPVLYVTTAVNSSPDPGELAKSLTSLDDDEKKAIEGALAARADGSAAAAAASDIWCAAAGGAFILVDSANQKIWSYEVRGKGMSLTSIRSMTVDLMLSGVNTAPNPQTALAAFAKAAGQALRGLGVKQLDEPYVKALVNASAVGDSAKAGALQANSVNNVITLNFTQQHKLVTYKYIAGQGLRLASVRDDTVDQGLTILSRMIQEKNLAATAFTQAVKSGSKNPAETLRLLTYALGMDPSLHEAAEKNAGLKSALKDEWDGLMAAATKADGELKAKLDGIEQAAQAERDRRAKKKDK